ncbi:UNVERIFIED_CONTAM: hypothetical protein FKN15_070915 [Acipenser sinensis]
MDQAGVSQRGMNSWSESPELESAGLECERLGAGIQGDSDPAGQLQSRFKSGTAKSSVSRARLYIHSVILIRTSSASQSPGRAPSTQS